MKYGNYNSIVVEATMTDSRNGVATSETVERIRAAGAGFGMVILHVGDQTNYLYPSMFATPFSMNATQNAHFTGINNQAVPFSVVVNLDTGAVTFTQGE